MQDTKTRSYDYEPPFTDFRSAAGLSGLEVLHRVIAGDFPAPPISATLGFALVEVEKGHAVFEGNTAEWQYNPLGSVHGGWIATLLDSALGCAVHSLLEPGQLYTTLDLSVRFVRPVLSSTGRVRAEGKVVHPGRKVATAEGRLVSPDGTLFATATAGCIITSPTR